MSAKSMSLKEKIKNYAKSNKIAAQVVLQNYMFERVLERLSKSKYKNNFILKGGLLLSSIMGIDTRTTMDMDTCIKGINLDDTQLYEVLNEILSIDVNDNIKFYIKNSKPIREDDDYGGLKYNLLAQYENLRVNLSIDIATGDLITPKEIEYDYKMMFEDRSLQIMTYNIETIIAENICLSEYLSGIEAFIDCSYKQINFAKYLSDINGYESYCYNEEEYSVDEENISIKNFVKDGKITFLKIPIITEDEESEFLKAYDVLEDYQEALDKIGNYEAINIWGDEDEFEDYDFIIEESSESIIGGYTLGGFRNQFHHGSLTPVKPEIIKKGVVTGESNAVLPYNEENTFKGRFSWENTDTCYVKNVLLSGLRIKIPYLVDGVILKGAVINIFNREFIPNVSRNNISASQQEKLSYAIGKAIHLWIRDHAELSTEQKALLDVFIETKYKETNYCLR